MAVPDPDLEIRGEGGGGRGEGGGGLPKNFFQPFEPQFSLKRSGGGGRGGSPPGPSHGSATEWYGLGCAGGQIGQ